jgi:hypothetical protein
VEQLRDYQEWKQLVDRSKKMLEASRCLANLSAGNREASFAITSLSGGSFLEIGLWQQALNRREVHNLLVQFFENYQRRLQENGYD